MISIYLYIKVGRAGGRERTWGRAAKPTRRAVGGRYVRLSRNTIVAMVVAYVRLFASLEHNVTPKSRIYALLLPSADTKRWAELSVRQSPLSGFGVYPRQAGELDWLNMSLTPVLLPYLGV